MNSNVFINSIIKIMNDNDIKSDKIHVQKFISFLADKYKEEIPFIFTIYKYGPFSSELRYELDTMVLWGDLLVDGSCYRCSSNVKGELGIELYKKYEHDIKLYKEIIGDLSFDNMELYGTLLFLISHNSQNKEHIVKLFIDEKGNKFSKHEIENAYDKIIGKNLL